MKPKNWIILLVIVSMTISISFSFNRDNEKGRHQTVITAQPSPQKGIGLKDPGQFD